jgi:RNA-directed DNA polymerase
VPKTKQEPSVDSLRHAEYYGMQQTYDDLYAKSKNGELFPKLMDIVLSRENILLAYRNIKANSGSNTPGTDRLTIKNIGCLSTEEVVDKVRRIVNGKRGYYPKPVRRKDIPKPNGSTRPLGIPCIWDRLIQQCIKQVMEPICEAKFSNNSYGFRPGRSVEHAISRTYQLMQLSHLHYVIEFDIRGFFDNVCHTKLIRQIWAMGIHDKHLIYVVKQILKAPIRMPDGSIEHPQRGTPQGGIISPLLANIVLNELDHWVESQWQEHPMVRKYAILINKNGGENKGAGYHAMKKTGLKEMFIVRYADDFRIFCRTKSSAERTKIAVTQWLMKRLRLEVSEEKTKIVNVKRRYSEFLGFKIKVHPKAGKQVVTSHICDKRLQAEREKLIGQAKQMVCPRYGKTELDEIRIYNSMVMGIQEYYKIATAVNLDCRFLNRAVMTVLTSRLKTQTGNRLVKTGRKLTKVEKERYGKSAMIRYVAGSDEPIYPIGYIQHKHAKGYPLGKCYYSPTGRRTVHENLRINTPLMLKLMRQPSFGYNAEYMDNRISLFSAQWGKCAVTGRDFRTLDEIHCHHKTPKEAGGSDEYGNLILVLKSVHKLIHAKEASVIVRYSTLLNLDQKQMVALNKLRCLAGLPEIN